MQCVIQNENCLKISSGSDISTVAYSNVDEEVNNVYKIIAGIVVQNISNALECTNLELNSS